MIPILLPLIVASLVPHSSLIYSVQVNVNNTIYSFTYIFTIICIKNNTIEFNLTIVGNNYYNVMEYTVDEDNPYPLPINCMAFNTTNLEFIRNTTLNGNLTKEFSGIFDALGKYKVPVTVYFHDGILQQLNGTYNGVSVYVSREYPTIVSTTPSSESLSNYLTLIIFIVVLIIAIFVLIKIGKI
ncbi:MAG: hypothetical protein OWQ50_02330 [Acidianus infernus]|uniref:hypothetical protein n=1 Tax=Acidianus infernus TaxID=12915 RepID=UPI002274EAAC|nr:hypothetical protein [Acidianus infernus]MCY0882654.1 hypothetical protein [Acidianus infernus]